MNTWLRRLGLLLAAGPLLACTVMTPLGTDPAALRAQLARGDEVEVLTVDGQTLRFTVAGIDEAGLHTGSRTIAYGDIQRLSRKQISTGRTTLLILGVVAAGAAAAGGGGGGGGSGGGGGGY